MAEIANPNIPTFYERPATRDARNAEYPGNPFTDDVGDGTTANPYLGCNRAGSCAPGIGINTGDYDPKVTDWSRDVRDAYDSQNIGGSGLGDGDDSTVSVLRVSGFVGGVFDTNDQLSFVQTAGAVAPGADLTTGVVNRTGKTVPSGSWAWGTKTQA